ncbi:hypothetical protein K439DRAFT_1638853 [Ramaria rubella]|nr:hypothetical protein K439DRAFT_1638853 [Ramaria rubella]
MSKEINAPERIIDDWPPRSLLDLHYGVVCFNKFGIKTYVQPLINAEYYPEGVETHNERMKKELGLAKQKAEEEKVREREEVPDDMFDIVLKTSLWFHETLEEERNRKVHDISVDKVERWMQSTAFTAF